MAGRFVDVSGRKLINNFIFSNNHECNYTKTISHLGRREYLRLIVKSHPGAPLTYFNDGGVRRIFWGLTFWPKGIFLGL